MRKCVLSFILLFLAPVYGKKVCCPDPLQVLDTFALQKCASSNPFIQALRQKSCKGQVTPTDADIIIVGFGNAGGTAARWISEIKDEAGNYRYRVLVLEAGENRSSDPVVNAGVLELPLITIPLQFGPEYSKTFAVPMFPGIPSVDPHSEGRMWGGSSAHNFFLAVRGDNYDEWARASGDKSWGYEGLLPLAKFFERYQPQGSEADLSQRGVNGFINVSGLFPFPFLVGSPLAQIYAKVVGAPLVPDYNVKLSTNISVPQFYTTPDLNTRSYVINAFFPLSILAADGKAADGRNLLVVSKATVNKVIFDGATAVGVEYIVDGVKEHVVHARANHTVILSAGAIETPSILQRSGVGPSDLLKNLNIPVVVDNIHVGAHHKTHYGFIALTTGDTGPAQFLSFIDLRPFLPSDAVRRYQIAVGTGIVPSFNGALRSLLTPISTPGIGYLSWNLRPKSEGSVRIVSTDPLANAKVDYRLYSDGDYQTPGTDAYAAVSALKVIKRFADASGLEMVYPPAAHFANDELLFSDVQFSYSVTNHYSGTCRLATSQAQGVVDKELNVFGTKGLKVADTSIMPTITTGNTAYPAYLIGLKVATFFGFQVPVQ